MPRHSDNGAYLTGTLALCVDIIPCTGSGDAWREEIKRDMAQLRALINKPSVISTSTIQELGGLAKKKAKLEGSLQQAHALAWDSHIRAQVTTSSVPLLEADEGGQKGLQSLT